MKKFKFRDEQKGAFFLVIIFLIILSVILFMAVSLRTDAIGERLADDQVIRVLSVMDDGENNVIFSNVLIYYPVSKKAAVVNIPGNTGAIYQSLGRVDRIDKVYEEKGIETYRKEIEKLLGCNIPFHMVFKLNDFIYLTDILNGLRIFNPSPVDTVSESGERWLLPSGAVNFDGDKISTYLKYHIEDENPSDEQERFQNVITAFFSTLHDKRSYIASGNVFSKKVLKLIHMNLDKDDSFRLLGMISEMDAETIVRQTVTGRVRIVDSQKLLFPLNNGEFIKEAVKQSTNMLLSSTGTYASRVYVLEIKNGTTVQGLAHNTSILFQNASYDVLSAMNADSNDYEKTVIIDHIGNKEIAAMVGDFIHCTNIVEEEVDLSNTESETAADVDFTIIIGKDFDGRYVRASR